MYFSDEQFSHLIFLSGLKINNKGYGAENKVLNSGCDNCFILYNIQLHF